VEIGYQSGLHLPDAGLWLDPLRSRSVAVISHAHSDHSRRHELTIATEPTHRLLAQRRQSGKRALVLPYGRAEQVGQASVTLYPAGHVLGSAQALVERGGHRLLYSGDLKLGASLTAEAAQTPHADTLVVESTYGRPQYCFPPQQEVWERMVVFCRDVLSRGETPVLYAYSLGKAQEILAALGAAGLPLSVHPAIDAVCRVYAECGVLLPPREVLQAGSSLDRVLIVPPQARRSALMAAVPRPRTAIVSGWAVDRGATYRFRCDAAFPISDHASYEELLEYVERVQPERVFTVHGFEADLAAALRRRGFNAFALTLPDQLSLF
jgi:Cft2 family RNA processing exonuclease